MGSLIGIIILLAAAVYGLYRKAAGGAKSVKPVTRPVPADVRQWEKIAKHYAVKYGVPWQIVLAQIWQESAGDPEAMGQDGEYGLMQLKPIAIRDLRRNGYSIGSNWRWDPDENIKAGAAFLQLQFKRSGTLADALGKVKADALESYNEGYATAVKDVEPDGYSIAVIKKAKAFGYVQ